MVRDKIEHEANAPPGEFLSRNRQTFGPAEVWIDNVVADAVGRPHVIRFNEIREGPTEVAKKPWFPMEM